MTAKDSFQSKVKELSTVERELSIVIPSQILKSELDKAYQSLSHKVNLKGFRKGKAPRNVLEQYYKADIEKDVLNKVLKLSFESALEEHSLKPIADPSIEATDAFSADKDFSFKAKIDIKPEIKLNKWKGLKFESPSYTIPDDLLNKELEKLQESHSTLVPVTDRKSILQGDIVECQVEASSDGKTIEFFSGKERSVEVGSGTFLKEVEQALVGKELDKTVQTKAQIPDTFHDESLRGKTAEFSIMANGIKTKKKPALDDEFAKDVSDRFESLDNLKTAITASLTENKARQEESEKRNAAIMALIEQNTFEVPGSLVDKQAEYAASQMLAQMPQKQAEEIWKKIGKQLKDEAKPNALKTVKASLLCEAIAKEANIQIDDKEIESELDQEAKQMKVTKQQLKAYYKDGGLDHIKFRLSNEKALDLVLENAEIKSVEKVFGA